MKLPRLLPKKSMTNVPTNLGWTWRVLEPFAGAWQKNIEWTRDTVLSFHAIFACVTLISSDISKLCIDLTSQDSNGIWSISKNQGLASVLDAPNNYQNRIQFIEQWINSKLIRGNTYVLKGRDSGGKVNRLWVLNPDLVLPLVTPGGDVYYQLSQDNLAGIQSAGIIAPASEIIHDRFNCLFHPLVGLSPIFASGLAAYQGLKIQENSAKFFKNMSRPSGILTAPGAISDETANRMKTSWESNYGGENIGKVAVLGDDLKYASLATNPEEAQLVQQLEMSAEVVCSTFHVPKYKVVGDPPAYNNIEALEQQYYSQCLQSLIESLELCLKLGLGVADKQAVRMNLDGLLRMDSATQVATLTKGIQGSLFTPDEGRKKANLPPLPGGNTIYMQQQNYSLAALEKRDAKEDPFASNRFTQTPPPAEGAAGQDTPQEDDPAAAEAAAKKNFFSILSKGFDSLYPVQ